jgi:hypothetical protein
MDKLNELLREYAQSIRRDDGMGFMHADAIRALFAAAPMTADQTECAYALIGRQLISSGLYDRMTDADGDDEAAGLISELVSVVDPILSTKYERHNAAPTPAAAQTAISEKPEDAAVYQGIADNYAKDFASQDECGAFEWLEAEISAVDCWHRGDPSYEHDAHWMKDKALRLVREAAKIFGARSAASPVSGAARDKAVAELEIARSDRAEGES